MSKTKPDRQWIVIATAIWMLVCFSLIHYGMDASDNGALVFGGFGVALGLCVAVMAWNE